jgi:hypothetical protein
MGYRFTLTNLNTLDSEVLANDPVGWQQGSYTLKRSDKYKSVLHEYSTALKFHCAGGGKQFVDAVYEADAVNGRIDILIEYDCDGSGNYDVLFNGLVNLATYTVEDDYTICQIERSDLYTRFINRDEISVDLESTVSIGGQSIAAADTIELPLSPSVIEYNDVWRTGDAYVYSYDKAAVAFSDSMVLFIPATQFDFTLDSSDINQAYSTAGSTTNATSFLTSALVRFNDNGISYPIQIDFELKFKGQLQILKTAGDRLGEGPQLRFGLYYGAELSTAALYAFVDVLLPAADDIVYPFDFNVADSIRINAGDSIWLSWIVSDVFQIATTNTFTLAEAGLFKIKSDTVYKATTTKAVLVHEAFNQIADAIADSNGNFVSNFYGRTDSQKQTYAANGCGAFIALTNGLNIRQFAGKPIYSSFKQLFEAMDCLHNLGAGYVNGKIQVEPLRYWYDNTTRIISLPFVNSYTVKDSNALYYNKIEVGYQKWESEFKGGLYEPNTKHEYATIVSSVKGTYQKLCSFITGSYAIEFTRRKNVSLMSSEDWRYDNDNFLIALSGKIKTAGRFRQSINAVEVPLQLSQLAAGHTIAISGTALNDGNYTIVSVEVFPATGNTRLIVAEALVNELSAGFYIQGVSVNMYGAELYDGAFTAGSGMVGLATAKNLRLTPKRMLLAHLNVLTAGLQKIKGFIKFVKGEGNTALQLTKLNTGCAEDFDGQPLAENQSLEWSDDRAANIRPLWFPQVYTFEYPLTYQQFKTIKANPNGYVEFFRFANDKKAGYILSMEYQLKTGITKFELLRLFAPEATGDENGNYIGDESGALIGG